MRFAATVLLAICSVTPAVFAQDMPLSQVLIDGEDWELIGEGYQFTEGPAVNRAGEVYFTDVRGNTIYRIGLDQQVSIFDDQAGGTSGMMFGADDRLYACRNREKKIVAYNADGSLDVLVEGIGCNDMLVTSDGGIYWTDPRTEKVWYRSPDGDVRAVIEGLRTNGIILWPHEGTLVVTDHFEPRLWAYRVEEDGSLTHGEAYYAPLRMLPGAEIPRSDGMTVDRDGRLYVATDAGLQMFDPTGRMGGVIHKPQQAFLSNVVFGGPELSYLYVTCQDKVYRRKTKTAGHPVFLNGSK